MAKSLQDNFGFFDFVPVGILVLRKDFTVIYWNSSLEEWTGINKRTMVGTNIFSHFPNLNSPKYLSRLQNIFEGGPPTIFSSQLHRHIIPARMQDGRFRIQHSMVTSIRASDGKSFYALFAIQDVTDLTYRIEKYREMRDHALDEIKERKRAEEELKKIHEELEIRVRERTADLISLNEELEREISERTNAEVELRKLISTLNALIDHIPEGVVLLDSKNHIILANDMGEEYLYKLANAVIGDKLTSIAGRYVNDFIVSDNDKIRYEVETGAPSKSVFEIAAAAIGQDITVGGMVLVLKDVTTERVLKERVHSNERLASVGQLAAGIAHDFNNILTGIIGFADILLTDSKLFEEDKKIVESIIQNGQRAAELIRQILDFSRKSISEMNSFDLLPLLKEFSKFIRRMIPENVEIILDYMPGEYVVFADSAKIQQLLTNLSVNARDAMPEGGKLILKLQYLSIAPGTSAPIPEITGGEWIVISVSDTGIGIAPAVYPHIFDPFFTTKDVDKGTGLGLSQVYGIVKQHDGYLELKTEIGKGSSFYIYLPASSEQAKLPACDEMIDLPRGGDKTIMVVEDNEMVRNLIKKNLRKFDYKVITAKNGKDALILFENRHDEIKLVITDLVMPEMGGIELCKMIKSKNPDVKVIGISGYPVGSDEKNFRSAGIQECILKPFQGKTFLQVVTRVLEKNID
jgi:PAS domain S-box-containing protein